jgi:hypothetical protein
MNFNPLNAKLNTIRHLLALLGARHIYHVSGVRVNWFQNSKISPQTYDVPSYSAEWYLSVNKVTLIVMCYL